MSQRLCPYCRSEAFVPIDLNITLKSSGVTHMACAGCGHIDLVADSETIQKAFEKTEETARLNKIEFMKESILEMDYEIEKYRKIASDKNRFADEVKEAKERLKNLELRRKYKLDQLRRETDPAWISRRPKRMIIG